MKNCKLEVSNSPLVLSLGKMGISELIFQNYKKCLDVDFSSLPKNGYPFDVAVCSKCETRGKQAKLHSWEHFNKS